MKLFLCIVLFTSTYADLLSQSRTKEATLKPLSTCCDIPELGDPKPLLECSNPKLPGPATCDAQNAGCVAPLNYEIGLLRLEYNYISNAHSCEQNKSGWTLLQSPSGRCNDVQCVFEKSGFLIDKNTLNKEAYKNHLRQWSEKHKEWSAAVERAIEDCVDKNLRQYLTYPCRAYDVFTCTGIAMLKKCPESSWNC